MEKSRIFFTLLFAVILFTSIIAINIDDAEAKKAKGVKNTFINSGLVCGDSLCSEPQSIEQKIQNYLDKLRGLTVDQQSRFSMGGIGPGLFQQNIEVDTIVPSLITTNGKIVFESLLDRNAEIYTMNADGSGVTRLTNIVESDGSPSWSPDGTKIAFSSTRDGNFEIYTMNADGSGVTRLTNIAGSDGSPRWSPDGTKIVFYSIRDGNYEIYTMNADGSGQTRLTNHPELDYFPSWSPDSTKIAFSSTRDGNAEIYTMNADGSGQTRLTNNSIRDLSPDWGKLPTALQ